MGTDGRLVPQYRAQPDRHHRGRNPRNTATAQPLSKDQGAEIFANYVSRHRRTATYLLPRVLGFSVDGSDADFRAVGEHLPFVRFVPRS